MLLQIPTRRVRGSLSQASSVVGTTDRMVSSDRPCAIKSAQSPAGPGRRVGCGIGVLVGLAVGLRVGVLERVAGGTVGVLGASVGASVCVGVLEGSAVATTATLMTRGVSVGSGAGGALSPHAASSAARRAGRVTEMIVLASFVIEPPGVRFGPWILLVF